MTVDAADLRWAATGTPVDAVACHAVAGESRCHPAGSYGVDIGTGPPPRPPHHCPLSTVHCPPSTILGSCHSVTPSLSTVYLFWSLYMCGPYPVCIYTVHLASPTRHPAQCSPTPTWIVVGTAPCDRFTVRPLPPVPTSVSLCTAGSRVIVPWRGRRGHLCALVHQDRSCPVGSSRAPIEQRKGPLLCYCRSMNANMCSNGLIAGHSRTGPGLLWLENMVLATYVEKILRF